MKPERPIAIAIILFIVLVLVFFWVWPEYKDFRKLQYDLGEKKAQYNAEKDYYAEITKKYYELQNSQSDLKKIDDALPQEPNLGKIIYYLEKTASGSGIIMMDLFLTNKSPSLAGSGEGVSAINDLNFSMNVLGSYPSLGKFITALEKSDRIFEVTTISFSAGNSAKLPGGAAAVSGGASQQVYNFSLQIKTHSY